MFVSGRPTVPMFEKNILENGLIRGNKKFELQRHKKFSENDLIPVKSLN